MSWLLEEIRNTVLPDDAVRVYGVILYTNKDAYIAKLLKDQTFWAALDELSGPHWAVFATRALPGEYTLAGGGGPGTIGFLRTVWKDPSANNELLKDFGIESTKHFPLLAIFALDTSGSILKRTVGIDGSSEAKAFDSLKRVFAEVSGFLSDILPQNRRDTQIVFDVVSERLAMHTEWQFVKAAAALLIKPVTFIIDKIGK